MNRPSSTWTLVCLVAMLTLATAAAGAVGEGSVDTTEGVAGDPNWSSNEDVLTVASDGSAAYDSVQAAVDAAEDGDTVRVRPGTYRETVTVDENITLVAPQGATLNGSTLGDEPTGNGPVGVDPTGIEIRRTAAPVVSGFTIVDYKIGITARGSLGDWELRETTLVNVSNRAIDATNSESDWRIRNVTVRRSDAGIEARDATGDWRVEDVVLRNVTGGDGVGALSTSGDWTLENVSAHGVEKVAVEASFAGGDWRITNATLRNASVGIGAFQTGGDWAVRRSTIANAKTDRGVRFVRPPYDAGVGVYANGSSGNWTLRGNEFVDNEAGGVVAPDADPAGDARRNWWGDAAGPGDDDCTGNVDCSESLDAWPPDRSLAPPSTPAVTTASVTAAPATDSNATATGEADEANRTTGTSTTAEGPLSPVLGVLALALGGLLAGRRARSRR